MMLHLLLIIVETLINQNTNFSQSITASDPNGIDSYWLNDTSIFSVDGNGLIESLSTLSTITKYNLELWVNDTKGNENTCHFYINVREVSVGTGNLCRYKKFGFYNIRIPFMKESNCL